MNTPKLVAIGVLALAGVFVSISAPAVRTAPPQAAVAGIPVSVADQLAAQGMSLSPASTDPDDVPASQAIDAAVTTYAFLGGDADSAQAVRVRYTDPNYGTIVDDTSGAVAPFNVDKDAWLVLIPDTTNFIFGPPSYTGPSTYDATLAVFVDATTGDVIQATTIADDASALAVIDTPTGRIIRVSYDRETHKITGDYQFCESRGTSPPRASCLRR